MWRWWGCSGVVCGAVGGVLTVVTCHRRVLHARTVPLGTHEQSPTTRGTTRDTTRGTTTSVVIPHSLDGEVLDIGRLKSVVRWGCPSLENVKVRGHFVLSYDTRLRIPRWVLEHVTRNKRRSSSSGEVTDRSSCQFAEDVSVPLLFRSTLSDYDRSGYDRGHLVPAANTSYDQDTQCDTFLLSNIAPQVGRGFNRDSWNMLEKYVRFLSKFYSQLYVCTGPLFLPRVDKDGRKVVTYEVIGRNHVAVPTHFFKVILMDCGDGNFEMECYVLPNATIKEGLQLNVYQVPLDSIERAAGFFVFSALPRQRLVRVNGVKHKFDWTQKSH